MQTNQTNSVNIPRFVPETMPIRLVIIISDLGRGGAERQAVTIVNGLNRRNFDAHIISLSSYVPLAENLIDRERVLHIVERRYSVDLTLIFRITKTLVGLRPNIVHGFLFDAEIVSRLAKPFCDDHVLIGSERNSDYREKTYRYLIRKATNGLMDFCIANSRHGAEFNQRVYSASNEKYRVVRNGVDTGVYKHSDRVLVRRKFEIPSQDLCIGMFASFKRQKNHELLVEAMQSAVKTLPRARLLLVGGKLQKGFGDTEEYSAEIYNRIAACGLRDKVRFFGPQDDLVDLYCACDVVVLPSFHEGLPNVILEAQSCEIPCIVSNVSDNSDVVVHGKTGFLFESGNAEELTDYLIILLSDQELRIRMGKAARQHVLRHYAVETMLNCLEETYRELA